MRDMPPCLAYRAEMANATGRTEIVERCECGAWLATTAPTPEQAEHEARRRRAPHTSHRRTVQT